MNNSEAVQLARSVLDLMEDKIYHTELEDIAKEYSGVRKVDQLKFLNRLYPLLNNLPVALWQSEEQRKESLLECVRYMEAATIKDIGEIKFSQLSTYISRSEHNLFSNKNKV
ncbi:MAG: type III secretion protein W [Cellvibrionaceae bacterium]|jgi:type III secretion protein W